MKLVKFIKPFSPYAVGDVAGLPDKDAKTAIDAEAAVLYKEKDEEKETTEEKTVKKPEKNKMVESAPVTK